MKGINGRFPRLNRNYLRNKQGGTAMTITTENVLFAFGLTMIAGLSTGIGSILAFYTKRTNKKFLSVTLGFSAGVMLYVSMIDIFTKARLDLEKALGSPTGYLVTTVAFFAGVFLIALIDKLVPDVENPHAMRDVEEMEAVGSEKKALMR